MRSRHLLMLAAMLLAGCTSHTASDGGVASSSSGTTSGGSSTGGSSSAGSNSGTSSGGASTGTTGISGTTTGFPPSSYFDGGYVFCSGSPADGGPARWMCEPGTYFCDLGDFGVCFQCRDDSDCVDSSLPTYDPRRPRCDLDSGVAGYQGYCQQCLADTDCVGNLEGTKCDLDPNFPADAIQPPIVTLGFEACGPLETDCRLLDGPLCRQFDERCEPTNGRCEAFTGACVTDEDCVGEFAGPYVLAPFCVGGTCQTCDGGLCPGGFCGTDYDCSFFGAPGSQVCNPASQRCGFACVNDAQCGGFWPACTGLDAGRVDADGGPEGVCGCDDSAQCGNGGLICIPATTSAFGTSIAVYTGVASTCGVPCTSPLSPPCPLLTGQPVCEPATGLCVPCILGSDWQCMGTFGAAGPTCFYDGEAPPPEPGYCGCLNDSDCPYGYACRGSCVPALPRCTNQSCGSAFCDFETGQCTQDAGHAAGPTPCVSDYECASGDLCIAGSCLQCVTDTDCLARGPTTRTLCCHIDADCYENGYLPGTCAPYCHTDADCAGNAAGSACEIDAGTDGVDVYFQCGCGSDSDCAGNSNGTHCVSGPGDPQFGACLCQTNADCRAGTWCYEQSCTAACYPGAECPGDFPCGASAQCQPRCDGHHVCPSSTPLCDIGNVVGQNGEGVYGDDAGDVVWCYQCLDSRDCPQGLGCEQGRCGRCLGDGDCFAGTICASDGVCHPTCDAGVCPSGQFCDQLDQAGSGSNVCYACVSPVDCPNGEGCDSVTHTCGTCEGPTALGGPDDCPPDAVCSNYETSGTGACLQNCDRVPCASGASICTVLPSLTPDHSYCFECLSDLDCADGGWCDRRFYACKNADEP